MRDLLKEYLTTLDALSVRNDEIKKALPTLRGERYFNALRRMESLQSMQDDTEFAVREMIRITRR